MSLKKILRLRYTLAFRLTLWYTIIFTISSFVTFLVFYLLTASVIHNRIEQSLLNEMSEFRHLFTLNRIDEFKILMNVEAQSEGTDKMFLRLLNQKGQILASTDTSSWGDISVSSAVLKKLSTGSENNFFETILPSGHSHKTRILYNVLGHKKFLQMGYSLKDDEKFLELLRDKFGIKIGSIIFFATLIGWFMAKRALGGVEKVTQTAEYISKGDLQRRVLVKTKHGEINRLITAFNSMLDHINALILSMREMTDNIAHDLRSPITRIRGFAEMTIISGKSIDDYENMAVNTIEECDRLLGIINTMLDITEIEAGAIKLSTVKINIAELIEDASDLFQPVAEDKRVAMSVNLPYSGYIYGDMNKLQRMIANLIDNAIKYTPSGGTVTVLLKGNEKQVNISVSDTGIGISKTDLPHIFKRFYRCDRSRSKTGSGLGLSLSLAIARIHGGNILAKSIPGKGSIFSVTIPRRRLS